MKKWMQYTGENVPRSSHGDLFTWNLEEARRLRDQGIKQVASNNENWMEQCIYLATQYAQKRGGSFTGEDIRFCCRQLVGQPKHANAWGALINTLIKRKIIEPTGEHRPMKDRVSHARSTPVYRAI